MSAADASVRAATLDDCIVVSALVHRLGLGAPTDAGTSQRIWDHLFRRNPAFALDRPRPVPGWVLEDAGEVVGFFGNIPLRYRFGERDLLVGSATNWAVEKPYRTRTNDLAKAYFAQTETDIVMATTANRAAGRIYERFSSARMPQPDYDRVLYWITGASGFLAAALRKKGIRPGIAELSGRALGGILTGAAAVAGAGLGRAGAGIETDVIPLAAVGDEFDNLWTRKLAEGRRLYAYRRAEDLRWHFEIADAGRRVRILGGRRGGRLDGYVALLRDNGGEAGLTRVRVADLLVAGDDAAVIGALLSAARDEARAWGAHVLEVVGLPRSIRREAQRLLPLRRVLPTFPFHYCAPSPELAAELASESAWYPTLYDGDSTLTTT